MTEELQKTISANGWDYSEFENEVQIEISWGDWKHDHLYCRSIMEKNDYALIEEIETEEDGSDCYSAVHRYKKLTPAESQMMKAWKELLMKSYLNA